MKTTLPLLMACCFLLSATNTNPHYTHPHYYPPVKKQYIPVPPGSINGTQIPAFYIGSTEVSNHDYRMFLLDLLQHNETEKFKLATVDTMKWKDFVVPNEPYATHYFQNIAYDYYPVVNVSKKGAELYAGWLTEKYNETKHEHVKFSLPTEVQWKLAAQGGQPDAVYGFKGDSLRIEKGRYKGERLANYRENSNSSHPAPYNPNVDVTAPVVTYLPNGYGIHNMSGNVAEMLADKDYTKGGSWWSKSDKLKISATEDYSGPSPTVGFRLVMIKEPTK